MTEQFKASILEAMKPLEGWCTPEKACVMADIVLEHKPKLVVETGVFGGKSAIPLAMALRENGSGVFYGIDPWSVEDAIAGEQGPEHVEWWSKKVDLDAIYAGFVKATMDLKLGRHLRWIYASSQQAAKMFPERSIDFFHQDGNHSEEVSCREVKQFAPLLKRKSFWIFDDSDWCSTQKALGLIEGYGFKAINADEKYKVFQRT